jgi:hypothetical protein
MADGLCDYCPVRQFTTKCWQLSMGSASTEYECILMIQLLRHQKSETAAGARAVFPPCNYGVHGAQVNRTFSPICSESYNNMSYSINTRNRNIGSKTTRAVRAAAHQLRQDKHQGMRQTRQKLTSASWLRPVCSGFHNLIRFNCAPFFASCRRHRVLTVTLPVCGLPDTSVEINNSRKQ